MLNRSHPALIIDILPLMSPHLRIFKKIATNKEEFEKQAVFCYLTFVSQIDVKNDVDVYQASLKSRTMSV